MSQTLEVVLEQVGPSTLRATARTHSTLVDRPVAKGGRDQGPMGGEYLVMALGGCFTSHLLAAIRAREASISDVRVAVKGTMDGSPERFVDFTVSVSATTDHPDMLAKLTTIAERSCQVMNTLRQSTPIRVTVEQPSTPTLP